MYRYVFALLAAPAFLSNASAQPGNLPLAPGVRPASPIGPGMQFLPQPAPRFDPAFGGGVGRTPAFGRRVNGSYYGGYGLGYGYGRGYYGPGFGFGYPGGYYDYGYYNAAPRVVEVAPPVRPEPTVVLANEFPATLTLQFPAAAEVWLNGSAVPGEAAEERVLTSRVLRPGEHFAFDVKARWTAGGKTYESLRTITLGAGDRSRLLVVSGTEVKAPRPGVSTPGHFARRTLRVCRYSWCSLSSPRACPSTGRARRSAPSARSRSG